MDGNRFDEWTRALGAGRSRRSALKALGGALAGGATLLLGTRVEAAAKDKVAICHKPGTPAQQTVEVPNAAVAGHLGHGDYLGPCCPAATPKNCAPGVCVATGGCCAASDCPAPANATATCADGVCGFACDAGFADCDGDPANGCEADLSSAETCGSCANDCTVANGTGACGDGGVCAIASCDAGFIQCGQACVTCEQALGSHITESENNIPGEWTQVGGTQWEGHWDNGAHAELTVSCAGYQVTVDRFDPDGASPGFVGHYVGTLDGTCQQISGTEQVHGYPWSATIP